MPRYKLTVEYDGTPFVGWQRQKNGLSVQETLETALGAINGEAPTVRGAGRTDSGVHATGQVAHVDLVRAWRPDLLREAVNARLRPHPVAVTVAAAVAADFDARHSAIRRHYEYRLYNRRAPLALNRQRGWLVKRKLDAGAMHEAAQILVGRHDFSTFRDSECQADSPIRTLERFEVMKDDDLILMKLCARSFLHRQVRSMVGSLEHVGSGRWTNDDLRRALEARDRKECGMVAPAAGLYLVCVDYPPGG
jgi:tRNA pseudouridine38-40 synthase